MKTIHKFLLLFLLFSFSLVAQDLSITCNMSAGTPSTPYAATGGKYKPSANASGQYFRVLIIFAQFASDNQSISNWPKNSLPDWASNIIDQNPSSSYRSNTISDYFKKMSNGTFDVIGDIYPSIITVPTNEDYGSANRYVLGVLNSNNFDFKQYDNWSFNGTNFVFSAQNGDGYVDMLYIIYRWGDNNDQTGWIGLAGGIANLNFSPEITTHDGVKINGDYYPSTISSGITLNCNGNATDNFTIVGNFSHELGHYLFGAGHTLMGGLMMGDPAPYFGTYAMSGYERLLLGYITSINLPADGGQVTLRDYVTTGDVLKIPVPFNNPNSPIFFVVENHQRLNQYDQIMRGGSLEGVTNQNTTVGSGLYVWTISGGNSYPANTDLKSGSGAWDWAYDGDYYAGPGWGLDKNDEGYLPEIKKSASDRNYGESSRYYDLILWHGIAAPKWVDKNPLTGQYEITRDVMGRETDAYNIGYNEVFSRWSNPSTYFSQANDVALQLLSQNGSNMTIKVCLSYNSALSLPPSKPQFLQTSLTTDGHMTLNWTANTEPDLYSYKIYKVITTGNEPTSYNYIATVSSSSTSWTDPTINTQNGFTKVFYKISAVDNSSQESVKSDYAVLNCLYGQIASSTTIPIGTFYICSNITIASGVTLTIQPGAVLNFSNGASLIVNGALIANGQSPSNPITFNFSGGYIQLYGSGSSSSSLQYAAINNAYYGVMFTTGSNGTIQNCILNNCAYGVYIYNSSPHVVNNQIINPSTGFIYIGGTSNPVVSGNTFIYQSNGPTLSGTVNIASNLTVSAGTTLTIQPGTTLNFASGTTLTVNGTLLVNGGNSVSPVTFNYTDAGQNIYITNGASMQVAPGATLNFSNGSSLTVTGTLTAVGTALDRITFNFNSLGYIQLYGSGTSNSSLQYVTVNNAPHGIMFTMGSNGSIQNSILNNNQYGVYIYYSSPQVLNNQIVNPSIQGIRIDGASSNPIISGNTITYQNNGPTWSGTVNITSNFTVDAGTTLTIQSGTTLNFASGATMTVNGTLIVNGGNPVTFNYADAGQNLYILRGGSMQVAPGATLNFSNGSSLTVTGTLTAVGTSNPITFNFGGSGYLQIYGSGASGSYLQYATINNGPGIMFTTGANAYIQNCTLNNCTWGVCIYNAAPNVVANWIINPSVDGIYIDASSYQPNIYGNYIKSITGSGSVGIDAADNSVPYISNNEIGGFNWGIYSGGSSVAQLTAPGYNTPTQNNLIYGNNIGLTAAWGGIVYGGISSSACGNNSIHGNIECDLYAYDSGTLYADYDYLGSSPKISWDGTSSVYHTNTLGTDPWNGATPSINKKNDSKKGNVVESVTIPNPVIADSSSSDIFTAFNLESKGDSSGAVTQYLSMLTQDSHADLAITELFKLIKRYSRNDLLTYFGSFSSSSKHFPLVSKLIADNNLQKGQFDKAISTYDNLSKNYPKDYIGINARFQKLFAYANIKNDMATAQQILTQIKTLNLTDPMWAAQIQMAENLINGSNTSLNKNQALGASKSIEPESIPKEYALSDNYPNPFNPATIISYQLPKDGIVTLKVFDILGREIKTLVNEYKTAGSYSVSFDASRLASGIYFYQLISGNFISIKKMVLTK